MMVRMFPARISAAILLIGFSAAPIRAQLLKTPAEESGYTRYSQHDDVARFLGAVDRAAREATVQVVGRTLGAKDLPSVNLYLCVITQEGIDNPRALKRSKPTALIVASQHGNEQSAKEAALALIRDVAVGDLKPLLKELNFLIIPQANPYGNFVNRRQNEQNLDLNRDHVKVESPETRAVHAVFRAWMPEVTLDVHEKGDDYYRVSTGCVSNLNIDERLQRYSRERLFREVEKSVARDGYTWHEYLVTEPVGSRSAAGVPDRPEEGKEREVLMRYSTTDLNDGRNSLGIYETLSFIQEGASRHDIETLQARTRWQYSGIRGLVEAVAGNAREVLSLVRGRRQELLRKARKPSASDLVYVRMEYVRDPKEPELTLKRFERQSGAPRPAQAEPQAITEVVKNWFPKVESQLAVPRPRGYIIPAAHQDVLKTLLDHGISVGALTRDTSVDVETYRVSDVVPAKDDYVAPVKIDVEKQRLRAAIRKGDFFVSGDQPAANLIPCLLEPQSEYGLIRYRAYKLVPERGAAFPFARVVKGRKLSVIPYRRPPGD